MIEEQKILDYMRESAYRPLKREELEAAFDVAQEELDAFYALLNRMEEEAVIVRTRTQCYGVPERMDLVAGRLQVKARGFGFVVPLREGDGDLYISATDLAGAMDGDRVLVRAKKTIGGARREGEIVRVVKRSRQTIVGTLSTHGGFGFVKPDDKHLNHDIFIPGEALKGAVDGQKVVISITEYPGHDGQTSASGEVLEILGFPNDPGVDILAIVRKYGLAEEFPREVLAAAESIPHEVDPAEIARRRDLRDEVIVTIDGADAKDLDDAVHVKLLANGNTLLGVHIADVSYYVREGSQLDKEAFDRGTSVYLVDRVIPMLPPRLSNGICSLHPRVDRLTLTCEMEWSPQLELVRHDIYPSVIRTTERMTYDEVRGILTHTDEEARVRYEPLIALFEQMEQLALLLRRKRMSRGAVDFDFAETKIKVNPEGVPLAIERRERSIAEMMIEEFMLAANETVAEHFFWLDMPFLYRVHEAPAPEKILALNDFVHHFGYHIKAAAGQIHPRTMQGLLEKVKGRKEATVISHLMLRSMRQARYSQESLGHFGLATEYYSHFTSPIRRYPDLMIHRVIREHVTVGVTDKRQSFLAAIMPEVASHCSERERNAVDAERETDLVKKIEYMQDKIGEQFEGMISGVTGFGLFVELDMLVEGLIHISYLEDDYYHYHENVHALIGERTKRTFRIGDRLRVRVQSANKEQLTIDFGLVEKLDIDDVDLLAQVGIEEDGRSGGGWGRSNGGPKRQQGHGQASAGGRQSSARSGSGTGSGGSGRGGAGRDGAGRDGTERRTRKAHVILEDAMVGVKNPLRKMASVVDQAADDSQAASGRSKRRRRKKSGTGVSAATTVDDSLTTDAAATAGREVKGERGGELESPSASAAPRKRRRRKKSGAGIVADSGAVPFEVADAGLPVPAAIATPSASEGVDATNKPRKERSRAPRKAVASTTQPRASASPAQEKTRVNLLPSKGGYAANVAEKYETTREKKRRERDALREIAQSYGVPIKDKGRRDRFSPR